MKEKPVVHTLATAAEFAKVEPKVILRWIREGLRATPVGTVGRRGKRDYRIFEAWLVEFMERRSEVAAPAEAEPKKSTRAAKRAGPKAEANDRGRLVW